ncbi:protein serine/threonine phosphatase 2C [Nadsonia fulvescens var. elongata DSM 6958]|uniref:Protein phosphatase n=1 Tax=Nadsonia fulvescens var. elongata DSM 6958 TaxID=857566 RepID=A0A1E3PMZ6_9ASCO|nr:protein serine/threonine phosphatase 2C [Nadsonia fulvescens var. elongata DSM 6958]
MRTDFKDCSVSPVPPINSSISPLRFCCATSRIPFHQYKNVSDTLIQKYYPPSLKVSLGSSRQTNTTFVKNADDSLLCSNQFLGIADGVSEWNEKSNGFTSLWSQLILLRTLNWLEKTMVNPAEFSILGDGSDSSLLTRAMDQSFDETNYVMENFGYMGSSTLLLAYLRLRKLQIMNIGDSRLWVIRDGQFIHTNEVQHTSAPGQIGTNSSIYPSDKAEISIIDIQPGDIVILMTDGISDNLWPEDILSITLEGLKSGGIQMAAKQLTANAFSTANDNYAVCPYMLHNESSMAYRGGRNDDATVCVAIVEENSA